MPTKPVSRETRSLRPVLDNPALPALIQSLPARDLAQLCGRIGIADAMHIMALAPAERLVQALDASDGTPAQEFPRSSTPRAH